MELVSKISKILQKKGCKISTAESCTAGYISNLLTSIPGSSNYFEGGIVVYSNEAKINVLGVEKELIDEHTEVSAEVACRMAERVKEVMNTDYSISTTGYADVNGFGTEENPAGTIYIAMSTPEGTYHKRLEFDNKDRGRNIYLASIEALEGLISLIKNQKALLP